MATNYLNPAYQTSVKFYASLTRNQAKGVDSIGNDAEGNPIYISSEPGAICFVADDLGNSIFMNTRLFGDGAISGGGSSGGGGGLTEVTLSDIVVLQKDGATLKTLADYFNADGTVISDSFKVITTKTNAEGTEYQVDAVVIDKNGITIGSSKVLTEADVENLTTTILTSANTSAQNFANTAETNAKAYADTLLGTVYKIKGSVTSYSDLVSISNPQAGDVYNVVNEYGIAGTADFIPAGTNYVYVAITDTSNSKYPGYWDALGGTINLSAYKTAVNTTAEIGEALQEAKTYADSLKTVIDGDITSINTGISGLDQRITGNSNNISTLSNNISTNAANIETNTTNITNIATQLTWQ